VKYQVLKEHYNVIGRSLMASLDQILAEEFTPKVKSAWIGLIRTISTLMISDNYEIIEEFE